MAKTKFTHLHLHTEYSLLDGLPKIKQLLAAVKAAGMDSVAITDHGVMYGAIEFYKACKEAGVKPILGIEAYVSKGSHLEKTKGDQYRDNNHLVLLAKNFKGYQNLMKLTSIAHMDGFYYKPRFDKKTLKKHSEGLICLSACMLGEVAEYLGLDEYDKAKKTATWYAKTFGEGNYYLEIQRHQYHDYLHNAPDDRIKNDLQSTGKREDKINIGLLKLSKELGLPLLATNDVHYLDQSHAQVQDTLVCVQTGKDVKDTNRLRYVDVPTFYLRTPEEMAELFADVPGAISNSQIIADSCEVDITLGEWYFPEFEIPGGKTAGEYLREISYQGAANLYANVQGQVSERLDYELKVIEDRGYSPYFLIVGDMVRWCREEGIVTTTRGSAAGSLVLYATGITEVDPLRYKLPFERFLNPFRPSPPDIDLDIADNRRGDLIAYITRKYGKEKVAQICTFGRMLARGSVRDIGRVLGYPYSFPDKVAKAIPQGSQGFPMTISKALSQGGDFKKLYSENSDAKKIIDLALQIEGNARHTSVHAAALVISPTDLTDFSPLQKESGGDKIITQYEMHAAEDVGLIKFDILGIRNLAILNSSIDIVRESLGIEVDIKKIPIDDKKTFEMLARGETMGTFQLGGQGMTRYLVELKPERVEDLMAMVALYRPGPMANIPEYIRRKNDPKLIKYMHPKMEDFLDASYGILVYQEDILFTALELAGYDWGTVDKLRKAIGKKIPEEMKKQEKKFISGCIEISGLTEKKARKIWDLFVPFQGYGFNKAHAAAYGIIAYQTAYMKANYPVEYMAAVLTAEAENTDKVVLAIQECKRMGIPVLPPDINQSQTDFTIVPDGNKKHKKAIRFGFSAIKNVGLAAIESIIEAREKEEEFQSLTHFCTVVEGRKANKRVVECLIKVGAMDSFGRRSAMIEGLAEIRDKAGKRQTSISTGQDSLFDDKQHKEASKIKDDLPGIPEYPKSQLLGFEKELLGLYLTDHPMAEALQQISEEVTHTLDELDHNLHKGNRVTVGGILARIKVVYTKKNNSEMAFGDLEDEKGNLDLVFFPKVWEKYKEKIKEDLPIMVSGKLDYRDEGLNLLVDTVRIITVSNQSTNSDFTIEIPRGTDKSVLMQIGKLLKSSPGSNTISIVLPNGGDAKKTVQLPYTVDYSQRVKSQISQIIK